MTVSSRALIPVAILRSFRTKRGTEQAKHYNWTGGEGLTKKRGRLGVRECAPTSCYSEDSHDSDDGGIDGQRCAQLQLLQSDAHDGQSHDGDVELVPPGHIK